MGLLLVQEGWHGEYDLRALGVPEAAFPQHGRLHGNRGKHSYTVEDCDTGARIEILLRSRAFFVKGIGHGAPESGECKTGSIAWKNDVMAAWASAKRRAFFS